jgi:phage terminase large subunit
VNKKLKIVAEYGPKYAGLFSYLRGEFPKDVDTVIITGGRGSGKSYPVAEFLTLAVLMLNQFKALVTRYTLVSSGASVVAEFEEKIEKHGLGSILLSVTRDYTKQIIHDSKKSNILFKGLKTSSGNQTAAQKSLKDISVWVLDEAEELIYESVFDKIQMSVRSNKHQNVSILILNPTHKQHFIYKRFFSTAGVQPGFNGIKDNVLYIHTDYRDNKHLPRNILAAYERLRLSDPKKYAHVVLGGWLDQAEGLIFPEWTALKTPPPNLRLLGFGKDFGFANDPTTLVAVYQIIGERESLFVRTLYAETGLFNSDIAERCSKLPRSKPIYADSAEIKSIAELSGPKYRLNIVPARKGSGSIMAGINKLKEFKIYYLEGDTLGEERSEYVWVEERNVEGKLSNVPIDKYNHCIDALRYFVYTHFV